MRTVRVVVPALIAVVGWFASGALADLGMASTLRTFTRLARLLAPDTLPVGITAPTPWNAVVGLATAVAIGGLFVLLCALFGVQRGVTGFAAAWAAAAVAGTVVAGLPLAFALAESVFRDPATPLLTMDLAATGAYWGVLWGWMPALAAALCSPRVAAAPAPRPHPVLVAVAAGTSAIGLVGLAVVSPVADAAWHARISAEAAAAAASVDEATQPVEGIAIPEVAPGDWRIDPTWCTENQLVFTAAHPDAATGHRGMRVTATNVSTAPCTIDGYPDLAFSDPVTNGFEVRVLHGSGMLGEPDAGAVAIDLAPGGTAEVDLTWDAQARSDRDPAGFLHIAAYPGAVRQLVPIDTDITGGEVEVTAWRLPAGDPAAADQGAG
ncbi:DUF4232 domain-containing protein [Agromyces intestinalis]|uniref:DUF4232 domain-containing protein n=1 Tax=Agromyces intestinalis TaxID=2592652 RepID=A0A5C1YHD0_9MICO|nr:DUF4232 domain-containing protein [Agromyces intestinalis]QEO15381.1 DUF4232 domain-containing protein [Agromyces intestinalis]